MFGYITPALPALTDEQKQRYRSMYCAVCHSLRRYGLSKRIPLSNDMTFLALLLSSLYEESVSTHSSRCPVHPVKRRPVRTTRWADYAADMNLLLFFHKLHDQVIDDRSLSARAGEKLFRGAFEQIRTAWPVQSKRVKDALEELWSLEKTSSPSADRLCNLSGKMLGSVYVPLPDSLWAGELYAVGESLGRFVYWMDAWEDLAQDIKKGRFNPLLAYREREDYDSFVRDILEIFVAEACAHFELLPLEEDLDLLRNILYSGVWQRYRMLQARSRKGKEAGPDEQ